MKAFDLAQALMACPYHEVILSRDSEGNVFSPAEALSEEIYVPDDDETGQIVLASLTTEAIEAGFTEEDLYLGEGGIPALVIWPAQ